MRKIIIKRNTDGDTRVATESPSIDRFDLSNYLHRKDVKTMMNNFAENIKDRAEKHDWSKTEEPYKSMFYRELCNTIEGRMNFEDGEWYKVHCAYERHHLLMNCPENVNLIDVIEMICDCVCAGMARSGCVRELEIDNDILNRAVDNTVEMLKNCVELED